VHEHWLDHLLGFLAELRGERDREIEVCMYNLFITVSEGHPENSGQGQDLSSDALQLSLRLEPHLKHIEHSSHIFDFLCRYVRYRHNLKLQFRDMVEDST
jgi:hypothetical protein